MQILRYFLVVAYSQSLAAANELNPADALVPEHLRVPISELDHSDFHRREAAANRLFEAGADAITALTEAAQSSSPEVSVRALEVLQRMYQGNDESTFESLENVFRILKSSDHLAVAALAERVFDSGSEIRQKRAIAQFERLGGTIHYSERRLDQQPLARPRIDYVMIGRDWVGGDEGLKLLTRIEDIRTSYNFTSLYIIRGIDISKEAVLDLMAELPNLAIQHRGPARLGIRSELRAAGCVVGGIDPGSPAELAGLKAQDEVVEIDGQEINSFEGLIEIVGEKEPGDEISLVYRRGLETHKTVAKLSGWVKPNTPANPPVPQPQRPIP